LVVEAAGIFAETGAVSAAALAVPAVDVVDAAVSGPDDAAPLAFAGCCRPAVTASLAVDGAAGVCMAVGLAGRTVGVFDDTERADAADAFDEARNAPSAGVTGAVGAPAGATPAGAVGACDVMAPADRAGGRADAGEGAGAADRCASAGMVFVASVTGAPGVTGVASVAFAPGVTGVASVAFAPGVTGVASVAFAPGVTGSTNSGTGAASATLAGACDAAVPVGSPGGLPDTASRAGAAVGRDAARELAAAGMRGAAGAAGPVLPLAAERDGSPAMLSRRGRAVLCATAAVGETGVVPGAVMR
jgi:hypothetical protein